MIGVLLLVASLVTALRGTTLVLEVSSAAEIANYTSERFIHEPDLWRVHMRTIHGVLDAIDSIANQSDRATRALIRAEYSFITGLFSVGIALGILIVAVTF